MLAPRTEDDLTNCFAHEAQRFLDSFKIELEVLSMRNLENIRASATLLEICIQAHLNLILLNEVVVQQDQTCGKQLNIVPCTTTVHKLDQ